MDDRKKKGITSKKTVLNVLIEFLQAFKGNGTSLTNKYGKCCKKKMFCFITELTRVFKTLRRRYSMMLISKFVLQIISLFSKYLS